MKQSCASCKHALFKGNDHYGQCTIHWCLDGSAHPMISKDWTCGSDCKDYYCYEKLAEIIVAHAAEVERLTRERDAYIKIRDEILSARAADVALMDSLAAERDAAIARAERAESCLRSLDPYFDFSALPSGAEGFVVTGDAAGLTEVFAEAASILSSPPADVSTQIGDHIGDATEMVGEAVSKKEKAELLQKVRRLEYLVRSAYREGFSTGEDSTIGEPDGYWERSEARAALADMEQKP